MARNVGVKCPAAILMLIALVMLAPTVLYSAEPVTWQRAIDRDNAEALWQLLPEADVFKTNEKGKNALMSAAKLGDLKMLEALRQRGLKLTDRSKTGGTTLMYAALGNQLSMVRYIHSEVSEKGFVDAESTNGWTALMIAAAKGFDKTVSLLVELGADPSLADVYQWSPLMRAIDNSHIKVVEYLLSLDRVDINVVNENGSTALHIAALKGDVVTAELLLGRSEIAVMTEDKSGKTALGIALEQGYTELADLLSTH